MYERKHNWREVIKKIDPETEARITAYVGHVVAKDSEIPRKYKELILMACSAAVRYGSSTRTHGSEAMYYGATDKEVIEALSLASLTAGFTAFIDGIEALGDQLTLDDPAP
jgi:alkylhydroperoxidase/carboxymuconolactone decarboxylase family protein YurZ